MESLYKKLYDKYDKLKVSFSLSLSLENRGNAYMF